MTLEEIGIEYRKSATNVREQLKELRRKKKEETDADKLFDIEYRIKILTSILTDMNKMVERCVNYYGSAHGSVEHGDRKPMERQRKRVRQSVAGEFTETIHERRARDNAERVNRETAGGCAFDTVRGENYGGSGEIAKRFKKYGL